MPGLMLSVRCIFLKSGLGMSQPWSLLYFLRYLKKGLIRLVTSVKKGVDLGRVSEHVCSAIRLVAGSSSMSHVHRVLDSSAKRLPTTWRMLNIVVIVIIITLNLRKVGT